jgi:hypothetical protein
MFELQPVLDAIVSLADEYTALAAIVTSTIAAWVLYGLLGTRYLDADDDFIERLRATLIPFLQRYALRSESLYVETRCRPREYVGYTTRTTDDVERTLQDSGFLRQPLASLHVDPDGREEVGSWSRPRRPLLPVEALARPLPAVGGILGRFVKSLDVILALRQTHVMLFVETVENGADRVHLFAHAEPNPVNPLVAYRHYRGRGFRPAPVMARRTLTAAGLDITPAGDWSHRHN